MLAVSQLAGCRLRPARHASSSYLTEPDDVLAGSQSINSLAWGNRELFFLSAASIWDVLVPFWFSMNENQGGWVRGAL